MTTTAAGRTSQLPAQAPGRRIPDEWHQQTEDEVAAAYEYGFLCGLRAASVAMDRALDEAVGGMTDSAKQIVERLVRAMDREAARARYE